MAQIKNNQEEIPFNHYAALYRQTDPEEVSARTGLPFDPVSRSFTLKLMQSVYTIAHPVFSVRFQSGPGDRLSGFPAGQIVVMRFLIEGHLIRSNGSYLAYRDMPWGDVYNANFRSRCINRLARTFAGREDEVAQKMHRLGGIPYEKGDIGWEFEFLPGLSIRFSIWNADDEFPPSAQILFSDNFSYAFSAEDMAFIGDIFIGILSKA